jgi:ribosomal protein S15P/S13E
MQTALDLTVAIFKQLEREFPITESTCPHDVDYKEHVKAFTRLHLNNQLWMTDLQDFVNSTAEACSLFLSPGALRTSPNTGTGVRASQLRSLEYMVENVQEEIEKWHSKHDHHNMRHLTIKVPWSIRKFINYAKEQPPMPASCRYSRKNPNLRNSHLLVWGEG